MNEKYIRRIIKKLTCSKRKREDIRKQLSSEILAAVENGEKMEDIMERMGDPAEIAEEFNSSFPDSEKKKYRKEKWIRRLSVLAVVIILLLLLAYWILPKSTALENSKIFHAEEVQAKAEEVIRFLNEEDFEALQDVSTDKIKPVMTKEFMDQAKSNFGADWGAFQSFGNIYLAEVRQMGKHSAVVQMSASYENASITYTLSFDENMELEGFWMK